MVKTGDKFGKLTVIGKAPSIKYRTSAHARVVVECGCGTIKPVENRHLQSGGTTSCGCNFRTGSESAFQRLWSNYKNNARNRFLTFELTREEFHALVEQECFYCGALPAQIMRSKTGVFTYNGVDRTDNSLGYVVSNSVACCHSCNLTKGVMSVAEFLQRITTIYKRHCSLVVPPHGFDPVSLAFFIPADVRYQLDLKHDPGDGYGGFGATAQND